MNSECEIDGEIGIRDVVGVWELESFRRHNESCGVQDYFGLRPRGSLIYSTDGYMSVLISARNRSYFASHEFLGGTASEKCYAFDTHCSYSGRYTVGSGSIISHHIEICSFPNWSGSVQKRHARREPGSLILTSDPIWADDAEWIYEARWRRSGPP